MKRVDLIKRLRTVAKEAGIDCRLIRQGAKHEQWQVGSIRLAIPRHREIGEGLAAKILKDAEQGQTR